MIVALVPFGIKSMQYINSSCFIGLLVNLLEFVHNCLAILHAYFSADIAHDMNQATLEMSLRIGLCQCCLHAHNAI